MFVLMPGGYCEKCGGGSHTATYVSSCCYMCVLMLLHVCPHAATCVSSCCYMCLLILLCICVLMLLQCFLILPDMCCLILLHMCPHAATYVSSCCYICVLMLLHMCPHAATYVSSYCDKCGGGSVEAALHAARSCYIRVLILQHMCPHAAPYVLWWWQRGGGCTRCPTSQRRSTWRESLSKFSNGRALPGVRPRHSWLSACSSCIGLVIALVWFVVWHDFVNVEHSSYVECWFARDTIRWRR
jgi:hypothetical protein